MISLVVFLGNYGKKYQNNRHNVAWLFSDTLSFLDTLNWQKKFKGEYAVAKIENENRALADSAPQGKGRALTDSSPRPMYFLKPETYMNLSGQSIAALCSFYQIKNDQVLVVHDELELPQGVLSLKWSGGLGGHNGLRSTKECLGTADFWRLRIGIGRPDHADVAGYVLSDFSQDEKSLLHFVFSEAGTLIEELKSKDPNSLLKEWTKKKVGQ